MDNIEMCQNNIAGVVQRQPYNPNSRIISLCDLVHDGAKYGTVLVLVILSITAASNNNVNVYQQKAGGVKMNNSTVRHDRNMVVMCPFSKTGENTAMILFGAGYCKRFFDGDISLRDNGEIRKYNIVVNIS